MAATLVGSVATALGTNPGTTPRVSNVPAGLAVGHLVVFAAFFAQLTTSTNLSCGTAGLTRYAAGAASTRAFAVFAEVVTDLSKYSSGTSSFQHTSSTTTRVVVVAQAWAPEAGREWDPASIAATASTWNASAHSSQTYQTPPTADLVLNFAYTNKSSTATATVHTSNGTDLTTATDIGGALPASDSGLSVARDGTTATYNQSQANGGTMTLTASYLPAITRTGTLSASSSLSGTVDSGPIVRTGTVSATSGLAGEYSIPLPAVTGHGFESIDQMIESLPGVTWAHRNLGLSYPEMSEWGVRVAANRGHGAIEVSCQRSSDGVWFGLHDEYLDRVLTGSAGTTMRADAMTWAAIQAAGPIIIGATGAPRPFATLQTLLTTLPDDFVFLVDPKQKGGTGSYLTEFMDIVDSLLGPSRAIIKIDGAATASRFQSVKNYVSTSEPGVQYRTAAYWYDTTTNFSTSIPPKMPYVDFAGLNVDPNLAADTYWTQLRAMCDDQTAIDGKPRFIWAHVASTQSAYDTGIAKGADFVQSTSTTIEPVGIENWHPVRTGTLGATAGLAGDAVVRMVRSGSVDAAAVAAGDSLVRFTRTGEISSAAAATGDSFVRFTRTGAVGAAASASGLTGLTGVVAASSSLSGAGDTSITVTGTLSATASATGSPTPRYARTGSLDTTAGLSGAESVSYARSGAITAAASLSGESVLRPIATGTIAAAASLTGDSGAVIVRTGTVAAAAGATDAGTVTRIVRAGTLEAGAELAGETSGGSPTRTGTLAATAALSGSPTPAYTRTGALGASAAPSGLQLVRFTRTGELGSTSEISGPYTVRMTRVGSIEAAAGLVGSSGTAIVVTGEISAVASAAAELIVRAVVTGVLEATATPSGDLAGVATRTGTAAAAASLSGVAVARHILTGSLTASSSLGGDVSGNDPVPEVRTLTVSVPVRTMEVDVAVVKMGDTSPVTITVGFDLTNTTRRLLARRFGEEVEEWAHTVVDVLAGVIQTIPSPTLDRGTYLIELEVLRNGERFTFPSVGYAQLQVVADLDHDYELEDAVV